MFAEYRANAMGTHVQIVVPDRDRSRLARAARRLEDLEARWSRFRPGSELSFLNAHPGVPVILSPETFEVVALAVDAWRATDGRFDPTVHDALVHQGYDRPFDQLPAVVDGGGSPVASPTPAQIVLDPELSAVTLPPGVRVDLGGIGKGAAADLIVDEFTGGGGHGICVNLGGDVRVRGEGPIAAGWLIVLRCPGSRETRAVELLDGAACTSTRLRRAWSNNAGPAHHLIEPRTGRPAGTGIASVSVVAAGAAQAEVLAKAAFLSGPDRGIELLEHHGVAGAVVTDDGLVHDIALPASARGDEHSSQTRCGCRLEWS